MIQYSHRQALTAVLVCFVLAASSAQAQLYVDVNATDSPHDGSDWCHAFLTLHEALNVATPPTVIRVADGTYMPDITGLSDPREATFQLTNGVTIEGGYAGCGAANPDARGVELYETTLSGDIGVADNNSDNCYHVVTGSGTDATAVLDGFRITGGNADGPSLYDHDVGAGVYNDSGSPTLTDCTFSSNSAAQGGGMYNYASSPDLTDCAFDRNAVSSSGGGMYNGYDLGTVSIRESDILGRSTR